MDKIWEEYETLRNKAELFYSKEKRCYFASSKDDVDFFFRSDNMTVDFPFRSTRQVFGKTMLDSDDERFTSTKKIIGSFFTVRAIKHYEDYFLNQIIIRVLEESLVSKNQVINFEQTIARRIPVLAILEIYGINTSHENFLFEKLDTIVKYINDPSCSLEAANQSRLDLCDFLEQCIDGLIDINPRGMLAQLDKTIFENKEDLLSTLIMVLTAGMATTVASFNSLIVNAYSNREQLLVNKGEEKWIKEFVEDTIRDLPPLHSTVRFVKSPFQYQNLKLKKNDVVNILIASANRDVCPIITDPNNIKKNKVNFSFGKGKHTCLGIQLAISELTLFMKHFLPFIEFYDLNTDVNSPMSGGAIKTFSNIRLIPISK